MKNLLIASKNIITIHKRVDWPFIHIPKEFFVLSLLFVITRLYNLTLLPIFTDESIYIYWAKHIGSTYSNWFMSLTDGKPPLLIWIMTVLLKIFPSEMYLVAGRLISIIAGFITLFGVYKLSLLLFRSKKTAIISGLLYIIIPFTLFYDRLALYDSFLSAMLVWSVNFSIKTSITYRKRDALLWGLFMGFALLTKPPAIIFVFLTPLCFFIHAFRRVVKKHIRKLLLLSIIAIGIAEVINGTQRLSLNYQLMTVKNQQFQLPLNEFLSSPFALMYQNMKDLLSWVISYYTPPLFVISLVGMTYLLFREFKKGAILLILWVTPIFIFATMGKILFARYILFTTPYFIIVVAETLKIFLERKIVGPLKIAIVVLLFFFAIRFDWYLLTSPPNAPLPKEEFDQYISSEYSGYGLAEIFEFLDKKIDNGPHVTVVTEGKFGLFPYAYSLKYWNDPRMTIIASWIPDKLEFDLYELRKSAEVYVVFKTQREVPRNYPLRFVLKVEKPVGNNYILLTALEDKK